MGIAGEDVPLQLGGIHREGDTLQDAGEIGDRFGVGISAGIGGITRIGICVIDGSEGVIVGEQRHPHSSGASQEFHRASCAKRKIDGNSREEL